MRGCDGRGCGLGVGVTRARVWPWREEVVVVLAGPPRATASIWSKLKYINDNPDYYVGGVQ